MAVERVRVLKREYASDGGDASDETAWPDEANPNEDALNARRYYLQDATSDDSDVYLDRDGDDLTLRDKNNTTGKTLTELLTESAHRTLRQLIHLIHDGPAEGFASGAYKETTPSGPFPTSEIWWTSSGKTAKIVELATTWTGAKITAEQWDVYDTDGTTSLVTISDAITYSGAFESSRTRTITIH